MERFIFPAIKTIEIKIDDYIVSYLSKEMATKVKTLAATVTLAMKLLAVQ